jgi:ABC-type nickel/cobalt efflux system permease component RcnA
MNISTWIKFVVVMLAIVAAVSCWIVWRDLQQQRAQLQAELKAAQAQISQTEARQQTRDQALKSLLNKMESQRAAVRTPAEVLTALPDVLPLPRPLSFEPLSTAQSPSTLVKGSSPPPNSTSRVLVPPEDMKPLYDFAVQCRECQARLTATQADLKDEQGKSQTLGRERDDALRVARGGSVLQRVVRATKWLVVGAAAGALAIKVATR